MTSKPTLSRRLAAEALGTMLLIIAVVGSGVMATNLTQDVGLQLLANSGATVGALISLILMFGWVSGAHFNPVVTIAAKFLDNFSSRDIVPYVIAQTIGGCIGTVIANLMFDLDAITLSTKIRTGSNIWLSEAVATIGLLLVIFLISRSGRTSAVPFAVGVWIGGAETSSDISSAGTYQEQMALVLGGGEYTALFTLSSPADLRIEAAGRGGTDPVMDLFDEAGTLVATDDDSGGNGAARIETSLEPGFYCAVL